MELSEHGVVFIVEETGCLQAKVYLQREVPNFPFSLLAKQGVSGLTLFNFRMQLFIRYEYGAQGRPRFGVSLGLLVDCLNTFSVPGRSTMIEIRYPGPDMQLLLKYVSLS